VPIVHILTRTNLGADAPTFVSVGVASGEVLARDVTRRGAIFVNTSANRISFGIGVAAVLDSGITLYPNGGTWMMNEQSFTLEAINAIASGADSNLAVQVFTA